MAEYINPGYIPNLPPFKAFLASNIPAVYDNTMSYYDELTALIHYIEKEVIPAVNATGAATTQLQELFTELKSYVDNYFENLDVQEEINNKLDEMAEAGTLQEIITAYIQSNVAWIFDTVADMKLATNLIAGSYARTLGFHTINDGGGAIYKITDTGTANELDVIAVGSLYATLILPNIVSPEMFGAYGDNTHDDSASLQKAIDSLRDVKCLAKTYLISNSVYLGDRDSFNFDSSSATINYSGNSYAFILKRIYGANLHFGKVIANNGSCLRGYSTTGTTSPADYIIYLNIDFEYMSSLHRCMSFEVAGTGFINEVRIRGGQIAGGEYGIHFVSDPNHDFYGSNAFYCTDIGFEGTDTNYYFESPYHRFAGIICENDRFVENVESTHLVLVGKFARSKFTSWGIIDEPRIDLSLASVLLDVTLSYPIRSADMSKVYAQGIYYDKNGEKTYIFKGHYAYVPSTYTVNVTAGNVQCDKIGNICYLRLNGIKVDNKSCNIIDVDHALPVEFRPTNRNTSNICATSTGQTATFTVLKNGSLSFYSDDTNVTNKAFFGELIYDPLVNTNPE